MLQFRVFVLIMCAVNSCARSEEAVDVEPVRNSFHILPIATKYERFPESFEYPEIYVINARLDQRVYMADAEEVLKIFKAKPHSEYGDYVRNFRFLTIPMPWIVEKIYAEPNPFLKSNVGDWISYTINRANGELRAEVIRKTATHVTIEHVLKYGDKVDRRDTYTIPLTKCINRAAYLRCEENKITLERRIPGMTHFRDKELKINRYFYRGAPWTHTGEKWCSDEIPLDGMIREEIEWDNNLGRKLLELKDFGYGPKPKE